MCLMAVIFLIYYKKMDFLDLQQTNTATSCKLKLKIKNVLWESMVSYSL